MQKQLNQIISIEFTTELKKNITENQLLNIIPGQYEFKTISGKTLVLDFDDVDMESNTLKDIHYHASNLTSELKENAEEFIKELPNIIKISEFFFCVFENVDNEVKDIKDCCITCSLINRLKCFENDYLCIQSDELYSKIIFKDKLLKKANIVNFHESFMIK